MSSFNPATFPRTSRPTDSSNGLPLGLVKPSHLSDSSNETHRIMTCCKSVHSLSKAPSSSPVSCVAARPHRTWSPPPPSVPHPYLKRLPFPVYIHHTCPLPKYSSSLSVFIDRTLLPVSLYIFLPPIVVVRWVHGSYPAAAQTHDYHTALIPLPRMPYSSPAIP